jgi:hypothetical protein
LLLEGVGNFVNTSVPSVHWEWIIRWASYTPVLAYGARGAHTLATGASAVGDFESFFSENSALSVAKAPVAHSVSHSLYISAVQGSRI